MSKTIKLIKSFAGYPAWEYYLHWEYYYFSTLDEEYAIHKDIVEWMPSYFEEVKEWRIYPREPTPRLIVLSTNWWGARAYSHYR